MMNEEWDSPLSEGCPNGAGCLSALRLTKEHFIETDTPALLNNPDAAYTMLQKLDLANLGTKIGLNNL